MFFSGLSVDIVDIVLLSTNFLFFGKDFRQVSAFVPPLRGSSLGGLHPQVPLRFTWGYSWCHLYEVGVALRSFWPSGRRLEVFLHAIRLFRLNSQKNDRPNRESACNPIPTNNNLKNKNFRVFRVFSGYNNNPKNKNFVSFRVFSWLKKIGCGRLSTLRTRWTESTTIPRGRNSRKADFGLYL